MGLSQQGSDVTFPTAGGLILGGPRPMWMQPLEVKILLCSDSTREAPATEPINVTLWQQGQVMSSDVGKATCIYSHMRSLVIFVEFLCGGSIFFCWRVIIRNKHGDTWCVSWCDSCNVVGFMYVHIYISIYIYI